jgi:signal transduction histidine kinase
MRRRLILGAAYLLVVVIVGLAVPFGATLRSRLVDELGGRVEREAFAVGASIEDAVEAGHLSGIPATVNAVASRIGGRVLVTDARGIVIADSAGAAGTSYASRPEIGAALRGNANWQVRHSESLGYDLLVSAAPVRHGRAVIASVRISYPMSDLADSIYRAWLFLAAVGLVTLVIGLFLAAWLARWLIRPLRAAADVARRIAGGELDARIDETGPPEVQELARDTNEMTRRLKDMVRANREFAANASHQLRTPLTALRLSLEEAIEGSDPRAEAAAALVEADRLGAIVDSLLELGAETDRDAEEVDIGAVVRAVVAVRAHDGATTAPIAVSGGGRALAHADRVQQVLGNLVDNATRFAENTIRIDIAREDGSVRIRVDDDGPGIPPADRLRIFDRFWRGREPRGSGSGLGLAVARELVRADGGRIDVDASDLGGARFDITYPAATEVVASRRAAAGVASR